MRVEFDVSIEIEMPVIDDLRNDEIIAEIEKELQAIKAKIINVVKSHPEARAGITELKLNKTIRHI